MGTEIGILVCSIIISFVLGYNIGNLFGYIAGYKKGLQITRQVLDDYKLIYEKNKK
jgi:hypothetical protein